MGVRASSSQRLLAQSVVYLYEVLPSSTSWRPFHILTIYYCSLGLHLASRKNPTFVNVLSWAMVIKMIDYDPFFCLSQVERVRQLNSRFMSWKSDMSSHIPRPGRHVGSGTDNLVPCSSDGQMKQDHTSKLSRKWIGDARFGACVVFRKWCHRHLWSRKGGGGLKWFNCRWERLGEFMFACVGCVNVCAARLWHSASKINRAIETKVKDISKKTTNKRIYQVYALSLYFHMNSLSFQQHAWLMAHTSGVQAYSAKTVWKPIMLQLNEPKQVEKNHLGLFSCFAFWFSYIHKKTYL